MNKIIHFWQRYQNLIVFAGSLGTAFLGVFLILHATNYGPWAFSDSTTYIWTAHNLAAGQGLVIQNPNGGYDLLTWHPPLFSLLLSIPLLFNVDALLAIRWMNALCFGITVFLGSFSTWKFTRSFPVTVGVAALSVFALDLIFVFTGAMSEAIYFVLGLGALFLLVLGLSEKAKKSWLIAAGVLAGLSFLARYTGLAFIGTVIVVPFIFSDGAVRKRIVALLPAAIPAVLIPAAWSVFVFLQNRSFGGRKLLSEDRLRLNFTKYLENFWGVISDWFPYLFRGNHILPAGWKLAIGAVIVVIVLVIGLRIITKNPAPEKRIHLIWLTTTAVFLLAYLGFHVGSWIFSSAPPAVDRRLLSPILLAGILFLGAIFSLPQHAPDRRLRILQWLFLLYALVSLWYFHGKLQSFLYEQHHFGLGYTSKRWEDSELIRQVLQIDPQAEMASNNNAFILFYSGRFPRALKLPAAAEGVIDLPEKKTYLVLVRQLAIEAYGNAGDDYLRQIKQYCQIVFENDEGYICVWEG